MQVTEILSDNFCFIVFVSDSLSVSVFVALSLHPFKIKKHLSHSHCILLKLKINKWWTAFKKMFELKGPDPNFFFFCFWLDILWWCAQIELAKMLLEMGQSHLFEHWPEPGVDDDEKKGFFDQVFRILGLFELHLFSQENAHGFNSSPWNKFFIV